MIRVCIAGKSGWTGRAVADGGRGQPRISRSSRASRAPSPSLFDTAAEALDAVETDVFVDYTHASVVGANVAPRIERGVGVVVGSRAASRQRTTVEIDGLSRERGVGVIAAGNFSLRRGSRVALRGRGGTTSRAVGGGSTTRAPRSRTRPAGPRASSRSGSATCGSRWVDVLPGDTVGAAEARGATIAGTQVHSLRLPSFVVSTEVVLAGAG